MPLHLVLNVRPTHAFKTWALFGLESFYMLAVATLTFVSLLMCIRHWPHEVQTTDVVVILTTTSTMLGGIILLAKMIIRFSEETKRTYFNEQINHLLTVLVYVGTHVTATSSFVASETVLQRLSIKIPMSYALYSYLAWSYLVVAVMPIFSAITRSRALTKITVTIWFVQALLYYFATAFACIQISQHLTKSAL